MTDGTRTRDVQDHNLALYQLSYGHQIAAELLPGSGKVSTEAGATGDGAASGAVAFNDGAAVPLKP